LVVPLLMMGIKVKASTGNGGVEKRPSTIQFILQFLILLFSHQQKKRGNISAQFEQVRAGGEKRVGSFWTRALIPRRGRKKKAGSIPSIRTRR